MKNYCRCGCKSLLPPHRTFVHGHNLRLPEIQAKSHALSTGHLGHRHTGDMSRFGRHRIGVPPTNAFPKGVRISPATEFKKGNEPWNKGKPHLAREKNPNWGGGRTPESKALRQTHQYRNWRRAVYERDNYTCRRCHRRGVRLEPHHIKRFADYPELRFDVDNGVTLCYECHKLTRFASFNETFD